MIAGSKYLAAYDEAIAPDDLSQWNPPIVIERATVVRHVHGDGLRSSGLHRAGQRHHQTESERVKELSFSSLLA
jgi:hypothetical protein